MPWRTPWSHVGAAVMLLLSLSQGRTRPEVPGVPKEIADMLLRGPLAMPGDPDPEIRVGAAPAGFPSDLVLSGAEVVVASVSSHITVVVGTAPTVSAATVSKEEDRLAAVGWISAAPSRRGFASAPASLGASLCRGTDFAALSYAERPSGGSVFRIAVTRDPRRVCAPRPEFSLSDAPIPVMLPPTGAKTFGVNGGGSLDEFQSRTRLETTDPPRAIAAYYTRQLESAGWKVEGRMEDGAAMSVTRLSVTSKIGSRLTGILTITALDGSPYLDAAFRAVRNGAGH